LVNARSRTSPPGYNSGKCFPGGILILYRQALATPLHVDCVRCIRLKDSAFGAYYHHLVARGRPRRAAMMAVMRKMLMVAYRLLKTQETYDPTKVFAQAVVHSPASELQPVQPPLASMGA
jgi:hypothetical protein